MYYIEIERMNNTQSNLANETHESTTDSQWITSTKDILQIILINIQKSTFLKIYLSLYQVRQLSLNVHICFLSGTVRKSSIWRNQSTALKSLWSSWMTLVDMHIYVREWKYITMKYKDPLSWFNKVCEHFQFRHTGSPTAGWKTKNPSVKYTQHCSPPCKLVKSK